MNPDVQLTKMLLQLHKGSYRQETRVKKKPVPRKKSVLIKSSPPRHRDNDE